MARRRVRISLSEKIAEATGAPPPRRGSAVDRQRQKNGVGRSRELIRVQSLPRRALDPASVPDLSPVWRLARAKCLAPKCELCAAGSTLRPLQSAALFEAEAAGGLLAPITVGGGKELLCMLLPDALHSKRAVILTKPRLKRQMLEVDLPRYSRHFRVDPSVFEVVAYSELSSAKKADILDRIRPDLIVANECHQLRNKTAARTKRFLRYMRENPTCRFCGLSGTISNGTVRHYGHLAELALRAGSPLPAGFRELDDWARALDPPGEGESHPLAPGHLLHLCGEEGFIDAYESLTEDERIMFSLNTEQGPAVARRVARRVYRRRFTETPGVVTSRAGDGCDASLVIEARRPAIPQEVQLALTDLRRLWKIGDEELSEAHEVAAKAKQLACGFYYRWVWPGGIKDEEWLRARSAWHAELRHILRYRGGPGRDTPLQIMNAIRRGEITAQSWPDWERVRDRPQPPTEAVWVSDFLVDDVCAWAEGVADDAPALIWYTHACLAPRLEARGLHVFYPGDDALLHSRDRVAVASINSYQDGLNLQHFSRMLVVTPPANQAAWTQAVGRSHRSGQSADEVLVEVYAHDQSLRSAIAKAVEQARAVEDSEGGGMPKLLLAQRVGMEDFLDVDDVWNGLQI